MNYKEVVNKLATVCPECAECEARLLLEHIFAVSPAHILAEHDRDYSSDALDSAIARRLSGEPLQYIIGKTEFYGLTFQVSPDCLIPRADTELLCELLIRELPKNAHFLELCTGSGCIPIATIANREDTSCLSLELFEPTAKLAEINRKLNNIPDSKLKIITGNALDADFILTLGTFDAIVSNPPYIPSADIESLPSEVRREPRAALDGGADGMTFYRHFISSYGSMLKNDGFFAFEIGFDQAEAVRALSASFGYSSEIFWDYGGNDRVAVLRHII